jgi:hypothetical protein
VPKAAKKYRNKRPVFNQETNQINSGQAISAKAMSTPVLKPIKGVQPKAVSPTYDATTYVKKDIKWTLITALIIVVILVILYIFFH